LNIHKQAKASNNEYYYTKTISPASAVFILHFNNFSYSTFQMQPSLQKSVNFILNLTFVKSILTSDNNDILTNCWIVVVEETMVDKLHCQC